MWSAAGELEYASYLGGYNNDEAHGLDLVGSAAIICGWTTSSNHPTSGGAFDPTYDFSGLPDGFCLRINADRYPAYFGAGKPNSLGIVAELFASGIPSAADGSYEIWVESYLPGEVGYLFHGSATQAWPFAGGSLLIAPPIARGELIPFDFFGGGAATIEITPSMIGQTSYFQAWFTDPGDPWGVGTSGGLEVTWYP
jgi:hypothetical protein